MVAIRGCLLQEVDAESHFMLVQGEMHDTVAELKEFFTRIAVTLVLLNGILNRLPGETVF
jgi:predicted xylose isomerase-like sugar epimerase